MQYVTLIAIALLTNSLSSQTPPAINGPATAIAGSTIQVTISGNVTQVELNLGGANEQQSIPVTARKLTIAIPASAGPWITIAVGTGLERKFLRIEILRPEHPTS